MKSCETCKFKSDESKCFMCINFSQYMRIPVKAKRNNTVITKRTGSKYEEQNHRRLQQVVSDVMTGQVKNSGAGKQKGDQWIKGLVNIMEELKTSEKTTARGEKTFSIKKEWLDKLDREAPKENYDFWYLKFNYTGTLDTYVVIGEKMLYSLITSIISDRKIAKDCDDKIELYKKEANLTKAENIKLRTEVDLLKHKIKMLEKNED